MLYIRCVDLPRVIYSDKIYGFEEFFVNAKSNVRYVLKSFMFFSELLTTLFKLLVQKTALRGKFA